jgi:hypothetical protein
MTSLPFRIEPLQVLHVEQLRAFARALYRGVGFVVDLTRVLPG